MSNYHTRESFVTRLHERKTNPQTIMNLSVFYHIACMGNFKDVVAEQTRLLAHVGLTQVTTCVLGTSDQIDAVRSIAKANNITLTVPFTSPELTLYESPTLLRVRLFSQEHLSDGILYLHTKGVSQPDNAHKKQWRRVMQREVVAEWRRNLRLIEVADILGMDWRQDPHFPHFAGNFWMARCDWIANLPTLDEYRKTRKGWGVEHQGGRMACETWLGSAPWHHVESLGGYDTKLYSDEAFRFRIDVPGFEYGDAT